MKPFTAIIYQWETTYRCETIIYGSPTCLVQARRPAVYGFSLVACNTAKSAICNYLSHCYSVARDRVIKPLATICRSVRLSAHPRVAIFPSLQLGTGKTAAVRLVGKSCRVSVCPSAQRTRGASRAINRSAWREAACVSA